MLSLFLILIAAFFFTGIINRVKEHSIGAQRAWHFPANVSMWPRLFKKGVVYSETTSFVFRIAPTIYFSSVVMAMLVVPFGQSKGILSFGRRLYLSSLTCAGIGQVFQHYFGHGYRKQFRRHGRQPRSTLFDVCRAGFLYPDGFTGAYSPDIPVRSRKCLLLCISSSYISYALAILGTFVLMMIAMVENSRMPIDDPKDTPRTDNGSRSDDPRQQWFRSGV